jgi:hypothetical protein
MIHRAPLPAFFALVLLAAFRDAESAEPAKESNRRGLRAEYRTTGVLPGSRPEEGSRSALQRITIDADGTRLIYEEFIEEKTVKGSAVTGPPEGKKFILRMDLTPPVIYEVLERGKAYREHKGDLNEYQSDRRITEDQLIKNAKKLKKAEREELLKRNYLRADGKREVLVARHGGKPILGRPTENLVVTENGRTIIDALVTKDVPGAKSYYHLYRRLGAFSEEVLRELAKLDGLPLAGQVTVVTAVPAVKFEFEAVKMENVDLPPTAFDLPHGAVKVEDIPTEAACHACGKPIADPEHAPARGFEGGRVVFLCSEECWEKYRGGPKKK